MDYQRDTNFGPYQILSETIAQGPGGVIKKVYHKDWDQLCCVKILNKDQDQNGAQKEVKICSELKWIFHENLTRIFDIYETDEKVYIFQELCDHDLTKNEKFNYTQILELIIQISSGYDQLIRKQIYHRDIKQANILVKKNKEGKTIYKIVDFGISRKEQDRLETNSQGSKMKQAPEIAHTGYSYNADIFSFGLVLLELYLDFKIDGKFQKILFNFLKKYDFIQIQTAITDQDKQQLQKKQSNIFQFNPQDDIMKLINSLLFYESNRRMSWQDLNKQAQQLINQTNMTPISNRCRNISQNLQPHEAQIKNSQQQPQTPQQISLNKNIQQQSQPQINRNQQQGPQTQLRQNIGVTQQQRITQIQQPAQPFTNVPSKSQQIPFKNIQNQDNYHPKSNMPQQPFQAQKNSNQVLPPNYNYQNIQQQNQNQQYIQKQNYNYQNIQQQNQNQQYNYNQQNIQQQNQNQQQLQRQPQKTQMQPLNSNYFVQQGTKTKFQYPTIQTNNQTFAGYQMQGIPYANYK